MQHQELSTVMLEVVHPGDAEVDIEVLKSVPKEFRIDSEERANWLIKKIVAARNYSERVKAWCDQEQRRAAREEQTLLFLFGRQIEDWTRGETLKLRNRKSLQLPAGCIGFRRTASKLVIDDEKLVIAWAKQNCPEAISVIERLSKSVIDEYAKTTGAIPDQGIHIEPDTERFYIR